MDEQSPADVLALFERLAPEDRALALAALARYATRSPHGGPMMWLLGIHYAEVRPGYAECYMDVEQAHHNPAGIAHGGVAYALIDSAMGAAFYHALERPLGCATVELKINYVRPIQTGRLYAHAELVERTSRFGILTSQARDADGRLVALAQATFAIVDLAQLQASASAKPTS